jgi:hypothetical protein
MNPTTTTDYRTNLERTKRPPLTVDGVTWESWKTGILAYALIREDGRATISRNWGRSNGSTFTAALDGAVLGRLYRTEVSAIKAVARASREAAR